MRALSVVVLMFFGAIGVGVAQWRQIPGTEAERDAVIAVDDQYTYAGAYLGSLRRTADSGRTWEYANTGLPDSSIFVTMYAEPGLLLLGTGKGAFLSTDHGEQWQSVADNITKGKTVHQFHRYGRYVFMASDSGLARSSNGGLAWDTLHVVLRFPQSKYCLASTSRVLCVGLGSDGAARSGDSGETWQSANQGIGNVAINTMNGNRSVVFAGGGPGDLLLRSMDNGVSWINLNANVRGLSNGFYALVSYGDSSLVGVSGRGCIVSGDAGITWKVANDGFPTDLPAGPEFLFLTNTEIFTATVRFGCFRRPLSELITPPSSVEDAT